MNGTSDVFSGPAITALGLAAARSVESGRPDRLIDDPLARYLYTAAGADLPMLLDWPTTEAISSVQALHLHGSRYIGLRTRFYDDILIASAADGHRQAVLLGAGLDTRAYRLALPAELRFYEIDQPALLKWKRHTLNSRARPTCQLLDIGTDLRDDWATPLRDTGFDPTQPTIFIAEGLVAYLTPEQKATLLTKIDALAAPASRLALDQLLGDPHANNRLGTLTRRSGINMDQLIAHDHGIDLASLLTRSGWNTNAEPVDALARHYRRDLSNPFANGSSEQSTEPPWLQTGFLTADKAA